MTDYALPSLVGLLSADDVRTLRSLARRKSYADGEIIHQRGDRSGALGVVVEGVVKLYRPLSDGRQLLQATVLTGQHFGEHHAFVDAPRTHNAVAVGKTVIDTFSRRAFLHLLEHPGIVRAMHRVTSMRFGHALEIIDDLRSLPPEVRLAKLIATMQRSAGGAGTLDCLQEDLASLMGVSAMTLAKALRILRREKLIETGYRHVTIRDTNRLHAWIEERSL